MKSLILITIFVLSFSNFIGQLNGTYTVGQSGDDYSSLQLAISDIQANGMSGSVELLISNGVYYDFEINSITPPINDSLVIKSASGNPDSVVFRMAPFEIGGISNSKRISFQAISIAKNGSTNNDGLLQISNCENIYFYLCKIVDDQSLNYMSDATLNISTSQNIIFDSCYIASLSGLVPGTNNEYTIDTYNSSCHFYSDSIIGDIKNSYGLGSLDFYNCYLKINDGLNDFGNSIMESCNIEFYPWGSNHNLFVHTINNCTFDGNGTANLRVENLTNCIFQIPVDFRAATSLQIKNNIFYGDFTSTFSESQKIYGNSFYNKFKIDQDFASPVINNFFFDTVVLRGTFDLMHNNFSIESNVTIQGGRRINNNNFHNYYGNVTLNSFSNNNFSSNDSITLGYASYDSSPSYYDPQYTSATDLHVNNMALIGRAVNLTVPETQLDFDGENRLSYRTIGADEICIPYNLPDTINVDCGTEYPLVTCFNIDTTTLTWKPGIVMIDSNAAVPVVKVDGNTLIWLEDSMGNRIDSILFLPNSPIVGENSTIYNNCGYTSYISSNSYPNSSYHWQPSHLVDDSTSNAVNVSIDTVTTFIATVDMGVCGIKTDSITLIPDQTPIAMSSWEFSCLEATYTVTSICYDSVHWDLGDGTFSNQNQITHFYDLSGYYMVKLTVWNDGMMDSRTYNFSISDCSDLQDIAKSNMTVFPNPAYNTLNINGVITNQAYSILDLTGKVIDKGFVNKSDYAIDVNSLTNGVYFLRIMNKTIKFIKQ